MEPFNWTLDGPQGGSSMFWRIGEALDPTAIRTPDRPAHSLVMTQSTLPQHPIKINLLTYLLTYSVEQSPSLEANQFSASQEIPSFYGTRRFITAFISVHHLSLS